jgi:peptide methionine sulfoxide reductase msrA/msrB
VIVFRHTRSWLLIVPAALALGALFLLGARGTGGTQMGGKSPFVAVQGAEEAFFAGGCFWGVEYWLEKTPGVLLVESGYMGGHVDSPTYEQVCSGRTGHAETVHVLFDPKKTTYEAVARLFFEIHDPTQVNRQGPDVGDQYRSAVFYKTEAQKETAEKLIGELTKRGYKVATRLEPAGAFWRAEEYHQQYYDHKGTQPYCHARVKRFGD